MDSVKNPVNLPFSSETAVYMYRALYRRLLPGGPTVFIACMPKSGSTFLCTALREITGFQRTNLTYAWERGEQDLYLPRLVDDQRRSSVAQQHLRSNAPNLELLKAFEIRPVVLVRNLLDVVVSVRDHLLREGMHNFPSLNATDRFYEMTGRDQLDFIIEFAMPWYVQFYVGWYLAWYRQEVDMLWLSYEALAANWPTGIQCILDFHGLSSSPEEVEASVQRAHGDEKAALRINRGVAGLGRQHLTVDQCERIRTFARYFPEVDFEPVGIHDHVSPPVAQPA